MDENFVTQKTESQNFVTQKVKESKPNFFLEECVANMERDLNEKK